MTIPPVEFTVESHPIELTVEAQPIEFEIASTGLQGTQGIPGQGVATFSAPTAAVQTGTHRWYVGQAATITKVVASVSQPPTGSDVVIDVNLDGQTIFAQPSDRVRILAGENEGETAATVAVTVGQYLTVDIDQTGSLSPGIGLTVQVFF